MFEKISFHGVRPVLLTGVFLLFLLLFPGLSPALGDSSTYDPPADWVIHEDTTIDIQVHPTKDIVITIPEGVTLTTNASLTSGLDHSITIQGKGTLVAHGHHDDHNIYGIFCNNLILQDGITVKAFGARSTDSYSHGVYAANISLRTGATLYAWGGTSSSGTAGNGISFFGYYPPYTLTLDDSAVLQTSGGRSSDGTYAPAIDTYGFGSYKFPLTLTNAVTGQAWPSITATAAGEQTIAVSTSGQIWSDLGDLASYPLVEFGIHHHYFETSHTATTFTLECAKCHTTYTASLSDPSKVYDGQPAEAVLTLTSDFTPEYTFGHVIWKDSSGNELEHPPVDVGTYTAEIPVGYLGEVQHTLSVTFKITPAAVTILSAPDAESLVDGESLSDSVLSGGSASVPGSFSWQDPSIVPSVSDSGSTRYTVLFTPDSPNYASATTTVTLLVVSHSQEHISIVPVDTTVHVIHDHHSLSFATVGTPVENVLPLLSDITVDGHHLSSSDYTIVEAETPVLILSEEFLDTLSPGTHVLEEDFGTDITATVVFVVKDEKSVPKTGDSASPLLWLGLTVLSLSALLLLRKKRRA